MPLKTKRWDEPAEADDGVRILITRYRPRGVSKAAETWDAWEPNLGPTAELLKAFKDGGGGSPAAWATYRRHYLTQMRGQAKRIAELADKVRAGETVTLLCSSSCLRESRCHRSLLRELIEAQLAGPPSQ
jgi:uncharacterized protein YeaO (DUF488 family)